MGKFLPEFQQKSFAIGSTSCHRTWGTWSRRNLMKGHLECQIVKSVRWAVKKSTYADRGNV